MEEYQICTLPNGLRLIHRPTQSAVSYCGFTVNAGTRDEDEAYNGLAHFVEHTLFKGTTHRRASHILNRMEVVGGELNAYTAKEETVVYTIFPGVHLPRAMELLGDLVTDSQFPERELAKEREVVADEINLYLDTPAELIYDEFESLLFEGCSLGRNILGSTESLNGMTSAVARRFLTDYYTPGNMVFFFMGGYPFCPGEDVGRALFGPIEPPHEGDESSVALAGAGIHAHNRSRHTPVACHHRSPGLRPARPASPRVAVAQQLAGWSRHEQCAECEPAGETRLCLYGRVVGHFLYRHGSVYHLFRYRPSRHRPRNGRTSPWQSAGWSHRRSR